MLSKRGLASGWILGILTIIILVIVIFLFLKDGPSTTIDKSSTSENVNEIEAQNSPNDNTTNKTKLQNKTTSTSWNIDSSQGNSAGGGGSSSAASEEEYQNVTTYYNIKELLATDNPIGDKAELYGIAFQLSGIQMSDYFYFTDDARVMNNPNFLVYNEIDDHITVYNSINADIQQSIINLTGKVVNCNNVNDGKYCLVAKTII